MYIFPEMIDLGLKQNQSWPTEAHKNIAITLAICNPNVHCRDTLMDIVASVLKVSEDRIKKVTYEELRTKYDLPAILTV